MYPETDKMTEISVRVTVFSKISVIFLADTDEIAKISRRTHYSLLLYNLYYVNMSILFLTNL